jgi:hypothetical protein
LRTSSRRSSTSPRAPLGRSVRRSKLYV